MLKLRLENENHEMSGTEFRLSEYPTLIGRDNTDLLFEDVYMSAIHAAVWAEKNTNKMIVRDLCSANGTKVNGIKIKPHENTPVEEGAIINMGSTIFKVVS